MQYRPTVAMARSSPPSTVASRLITADDASGATAALAHEQGRLVQHPRWGSQSDRVDGRRQVDGAASALGTAVDAQPARDACLRIEQELDDMVARGGRPLDEATSCDLHHFLPSWGRGDHLCTLTHGPNQGTGN